MDVWFEYVLNFSGLIYRMKLREYEDACASLVLTAAGVAAVSAATAAAATTGAGARGEAGACVDAALGHHHATATATAEPGAPRKASASLNSSTTATPALSVDGATLNTSMASSAPTSRVAVEPPSSLTVAAAGPRTPAVQPSGIYSHGTTPTLSSSLPAHGLAGGADAGRRCSSPTVAGAPVSPAETVGALLDAMQLRRSMRSATARTRYVDDIQTEADLVFQELEDAFTLQPGDAAAVAAAVAASARLAGGGDEHAAGGDSERCLLYGELTSIGVRQLQAISMASTCVVREEHRRSRSRECGAGLPTYPTSTATGSLGCLSATLHGGTPTTLRGAAASMPHSHAHVHAHGAVVVAVDVGSGNGRLLFEWGRLASAACRRRHDPSRRRPAEEPPLFSGTGAAATHHGTTAPPHITAAAATVAAGGHPPPSAATTYAAAARRGNLLAAAYAPQGIAAPATVWRGWLGVGMELLPSRMRIARKALVPHYLNLKKALLVPAAVDGVFPAVTHLDPCPPEAIAVTGVAASYSAPASLHSGCVSNTTTTATATPLVGSPTVAEATISAALASRAPQPSARVLLYEGDALAPGVLSNGTLCRFPCLGHHGEPLLLRGSLAAHEGVTGGEHGWGAGSSTFPYAPPSAPSVAATAAAMNNTYLLHSTRPSAGYGRRCGAQTPINMSLASMTSNASSGCSARGAAAKHNYYRLSRVEGGPSLTGREDPHLVIFCCGLGFDEPQVRRLCQRIEDMLLRRPSTAIETPPPPPSAGGGDAMSATHLSEDGSTSPSPHNARLRHRHTGSEDVDAAESLDGSREEEDMDTRFDLRPSTPTIADPTIGVATGISGGFASHRHWESVTCVLLLRPMDVLPPTFPLFRYASRVYDTARHPIAAEDTALLLATGHRADGTAVPYTTRTTPATGCSPGSSVASDMIECDMWTTTLETTWMNAAPAWVVRFHF
ncbi:hypothetical protein NESM_000351900 [Novymonas esmeraldas]|uniref:Uncharacterized protein n=1 Tax=Novymonas esmeraldas TaxID=1808958 RepID=A0AAW0EN74_9TRYP